MADGGGAFQFDLLQIFSQSFRIELKNKKLLTFDELTFDEME